LTTIGFPEPDIPLPGDFIREELKKRGWTQSDLARILNCSTTRLNEVIKGNREIIPELAVALGAAFSTTPDLWLQRESEYRLQLHRREAMRLAGKTEGIDVLKRKKIFEMAPIKELQKRGWIRAGDDLSLIEEDIKNLLGITTLDEEPALCVSMRKTSPNAELTPAQKAWCFRVIRIARSMNVSEFREDRLGSCERELRKLAAYSQEARKVPTVLASYGIRFVVVEPLGGGKIDGIATWLDDQSPVIGMSIRFDRMDSFWHTLCHEFSHVRHRDAISVDVEDDVLDPHTLQVEVKSPVERRADLEAAASLIPPDEMESFIRRVGPLYSKERINQFANRIKIHPGIIVGQLQHRGEIGYAANRETLVKIRKVVIPVALTDGWGSTIDPRIIA
jgi:HTH-type transcriptional regulator / antitoxin HigA